MDLDKLNAAVIQKHMRLALDVVVAHRVVRGLSLELSRVTALRDLLEERVLRAIEETDDTQLPAEWSWELAVERISLQVALSIVEQQKGESAEPYS
jgi:hypothetical protein